MPLHLPEHLGRPIPDSPHAVSACLPTWADNIGYEEGEPRVTSQLTTGYPRFVYNALCREVFARASQVVCRDAESCLLFPSPGAASRAVAFVNSRLKQDIARQSAWSSHSGVHAVVFPTVHARIAQDAWQHMGEGISSRQAEDLLADRPPAEPGDVEEMIARRVAELAGVSTDNVWLASCGMSGFAAIHRAVDRLAPERGTVQFGFPYVDSLKVQQLCGSSDCWFLPRGDLAELDELETAMAQGRRPAGVFTEFPSNPLLAVPDLARLSDACRRHKVPLVVDETIAGFGNVNVLPVADAICSSLTKSFSGVGDVTGGSIVINPDSPFHQQLAELLADSPPTGLYGTDATTLEENSRDYADRLPVACENASQLVEYLRASPEVQAVYYPDAHNPAGDRGHETRFDRWTRPGAGRGPLFSILLRDAEHTTPVFYDRLAVDKGPNLGTNYTLACPFTILAHYHELDWAESCGVSRYLVRVSVGLEPFDGLKRAFADALSACQAVR